MKGIAPLSGAEGIQFWRYVAIMRASYHRHIHLNEECMSNVNELPMFLSGYTILKGCGMMDAN